MKFIGGFTNDIANELRIQVIYFRTTSACSLWAHFSVANIIEAGELPIRGRINLVSICKLLVVFLLISFGCCETRLEFKILLCAQGRPNKFGGLR